MTRRVALPLLLALGTLGVAQRAGAQGYYPAQPYTVPPQVGAYYPVQPGGFITGNPSPTFPGYDPNRPVAGSGSGSMHWDPYRGWVTNTQQTTVLNSALSPGRAPIPGSAVQNYGYWQGNQWIQGQRWLGQDGLWHGTNTGTTFTPNGGTVENTTVYSANPNRGRP
jgi:hypothetical protein